MRLSEQGLQLIRKFEGRRLTAYQDPVGVWTIGYGHTASVRPGMRITAERAEELLRADVARFEQVVRQQVKVPLTQGQFDALVSFVFNVGAGAFRRSTLLRRLNARDYMGAAMQFERWVQGRHRAHGERLTLPGLVRRRRAEARMFIAG